MVGGGSTRMGGRPKGLLPGRDGETSIAASLLGTAEAAELFPRWLIGDIDAYDALENEGAIRITDDPPGVGPLGGLRALLRAARDAGCEAVVLVACDMPFVDVDTLTALRDGPAPAAVGAYAARREDGAPWEPMLCRYTVAPALAAAEAALGEGRRSLQAVLGSMTTVRFHPPSERAFEDWDSPEDIRRERPAD